MIEAREVVKRFGDTVALKGVSLQARNGAVTGFVGPNGAGKSTLLRIVCGLVSADSGSATVDQALFRTTAHPGKTLGAFLSAEGIPENLTARSYLRYVCDLQGLPRSTADLGLQRVGLEDSADKKVKTFSLGMRQRLGIAGAFVGEPENLILDEPINGLDPDGIRWLRRYLRDRAASGRAVLLSSHHMSELALVADYVVMINDGHIVRSGPAESFTAEDVQRTYFETDDLTAAIQLLRGRGLRCETYNAGGLVWGATPRDVGAVLFGESLGATHLSQFRRTIEETYFDELSRSPEGGE